MLITDDSNGKSDGKERDQLQAMVAVGSEFITYQDDTSRVQKSGEFVRIEKNSSDSAPRFCLLHETSETHALDNYTFTGNDLRTLSPEIKLRKRSWLYVAETDPDNGDLPFKPINGFKSNTRVSRYQSTPMDSVRNFVAAYSSNYTSMAGKRRIFPVGDGRVLMLKEVNDPAEDRVYEDQRRSEEIDLDGFTRNRGLRAARVEVVPIDMITGTEKKAVLSFAVHSGVTGWVKNIIRNYTSRTTGEMFSGDPLYRAYISFAGVNFGADDDVAFGTTPIGGDMSDTYAFAEPAVFKSHGKDILSLVAIYPTSEDVHDPASSGAYRLTCQYVDVDGNVAYSKISMPPIAGHPSNYLSPTGMVLYRMSPTTLAARISCHVMELGLSGDTRSDTVGTVFQWSDDNGATWYYTPTIMWGSTLPSGGTIVKDKDTLLVFTWYTTGAASMLYNITKTAATMSPSIYVPDSIFNEGLATLNGGVYGTKYYPVGFGGVVYKMVDKKKKKRLWMQFDPSWIYKDGTSHTLQYPSCRPQLAVSDDGGVTWERRLLPTVWSFLAGFVVSVDGDTLAIPITSPRTFFGQPPKVTVYVSKDGGDSWKPSNASVTLPGESWSDGNILIGAPYLDSHGATLFEQDVTDVCTRYNRGELLPLVAIKDSKGNNLPSNAARPWMNDYRIKEPTYG